MGQLIIIKMSGIQPALSLNPILKYCYSSKDGPLFINGVVPKRGWLRVKNFSHPCFYNIQKFNTQPFKGSKVSLPNPLRKILMVIMALKNNSLTKEAFW